MKPYMCLLQVGNTALHRAAISGRYDVIRLLIDAGMSVDTKGLVSWYVCIYLCSQYISMYLYM